MPSLGALPAWVRQHNQPVTYPRLFVEVARERGIPPETVLQRAGLPAMLLDDPAGRVSPLEAWSLFAAVQALTGDPLLGFETGYRLPLTAHGSMGFALMCAPSAREGLSILQKYWHLRGRGLALNVQETENTLFLEVTPELPMAPELRDFLLPSVLTSVWHGICFVVPEARATSEIWLQGVEPEGFDTWKERLPTIRFGMPTSGVRITGEKSRLDTPLPTANPEGLANALAQCERESLLMGGGADPVLQRTRIALQASTHGYPEPEEIARTLHMTPRTFRRRLQEQGSNYRQLLEEARKRDACRLLEKPELEIRQISQMLGYAEPANFTRAFRSWTGKTPSDWRTPPDV